MKNSNVPIEESYSDPFDGKHPSSPYDFQRTGS